MLTITTLKAFTIDPRTVELRRAVRHASAVAEYEAAYVAPIHAGLLAAANLEDERGEKITDTERLYLCQDEEAVATLYKAIDAAHRANGLDLEPDHCPKLIAEAALIDAQRALRDAASRELGFPSPVNLDHVRQLDALLLDVPKGR